MVELTLPNTKLCICRAELIKMKTTLLFFFFWRSIEFQNTVLKNLNCLEYCQKVSIY